MIPKNIRLPLLLFFYTAVVLATLLCICLLYLEKEAMEQDLLKWQQKTMELHNELERINRYAKDYETTPEIVAAVIRECEKYDIEPKIMLELIDLESDFNAQAVSSHGAAGLCQIRPFTARELARELGLEYSYEQLFNSDYNVTLATYYLSKLLKMHEQDFHKALTAYNRGPTGLKNYIARTGQAASSYSLRISRALE